MAQLFKVIARILDLLTMRKEPSRAHIPLLSFNREELGAKIERLSVSLYRCRTEDSVKIIREVIEAARNIQILEVNRATPEKFAHHMGRLEALSDIAVFFEQSMDPAIYEQRRERENNKTRILMKKNQRSEAVI